MYKTSVEVESLREMKSSKLDDLKHGISEGFTHIKGFMHELQQAHNEHVKEEVEILQLRLKDYTVKAVALFYVDVIFDIMFSFVADKLEDLVHIVLFCLTIPVRWIFRVLHRSRCGKAEFVSIWRSNYMCEEVNKKNKLHCQHCQYRFSHRMSTFGVLLRKLGEEEKKDEGSYDFDGRRLFYFDFKFQSYDSVNNYTNLATIMFFLCIYSSAVRALSFSEKNWFTSFINWLDEWFHYQLTLSHFTLICVWIIIFLILRIVERVYFLLGLIKEPASERKISIEGLVFWNSLREPIDRLLRWNEKDSHTYFHTLVTEFQLLFVRFFCDEDTFLKMRRKYRDSNMFLQNQLSFHKNVFGFVIALIASLVVKYFIEGSYSLEFVPRTECTAVRGYCIDHELEDECWCAINLLHDVASSILVALLGAIASVATVRAAMNEIFKFWRQRKLTYRFACITERGGDVNPTFVRSNTNVKEKEYDPVIDYAIIPCNADIHSAFYGIGRDDLFNYIKDVSNQKERIRSEDIYTRMSKYVDVTEQVKDYLVQSRGNAIFSIIPKKKHCLVISGYIRGAEDALRDVTQVFRISDKDNKTLWERELFTWTGKHHEMQGDVSVAKQNSPELVYVN